jgi:uncharacterized protein (TIGR03118 family)
VGNHIFVTYIWPAPVDGNDSPTGGYVDEFDANGKLLAHVGRMGPLNAPWGIALAPRSFGRFGGDLLVGDFGDGRINAFRRAGRRWIFAGALPGPDGKPLAVNGIWGHRLRERRRGRVAGQPLLRLGTAPVAGRDRVGRARADRLHLGYVVPLRRSPVGRLD